MNYQKIILLGNVISKPDTFISDENIKYDRMTFDLSVKYIVSDEVVFSVVIPGPLSDMVDKQISKGKQVLVEGRIEMEENGKMKVLADWVQLDGIFEETNDKEK